MMRPMAVLIAGLTLGVPEAAQASDTFDAFQQICVIAHARAADALAAADKAGWMPVPDAMMASLPKTGLIANPQGRMRSSQTGLMIVLTGVGTIPNLGNAHGDICAVMHAPPEPALDQEIAALAAVPKDAKQSSDRTNYFWREEDGKHVPISSEDADVKAALQNGPVDVLMEQTSEKLSLATLVVASQ